MKCVDEGDPEKPLEMHIPALVKASEVVKIDLALNWLENLFKE